MAYKNFKATEIMEEIGLELRKVRLEQGYTISHVAEQLTESGLPISNTLFGRVENGERRIDDDALIRICNFYKIDPRTIVIAASNEHIQKFSGEDTLSGTADQTESVMTLFNNLNQKGQQEVSQLMRMMAYMDIFKKVSRGKDLRKE